jgi:hypothetical protein
LIILGSLLVVIIAGSINRRIGGVLGVIFTLGLTYWGLNVMKSGGELYLLNFHLKKEVFLILMALFFIYNLTIAIVGVKKQGD